VIGKPDFKVSVNGHQPIRVELLSTGQSEVLSLIMYVHLSQTSFDTILIDEPEVHLNWSLEKALFEYIDDFCSEYQKQAIVVTHSRIIFNKKFLPNCQFLAWENDKVLVRSKLSSDELEKIAGEVASVVLNVVQTPNVVFVEDRAHDEAITAVATALGRKIEIVRCGNKENVKSMARLSKQPGSKLEKNGYFVVDGDGEGQPKEFNGYDRFVKLRGYSIESYFVHPEYAAAAFEINTDEFKQIIIKAMLEVSDKICGKSKNFELFKIALRNLKSDDLTPDFFMKFDCTELLDRLLVNFGVTKTEFFTKFVSKATDALTLSNIFDSDLISLLNRLEKL
jgi:hypothetical protein